MGNLQSFSLTMSEEISIKLGSIEAKVDELLKIRQDHEGRIRTLETMAQQAKGGWFIVSVLVGIAGGVGAFVTWILSHFKP